MLSITSGSAFPPHSFPGRIPWAPYRSTGALIKDSVSLFPPHCTPPLEGAGGGGDPPHVEESVWLRHRRQVRGEPYPPPPSPSAPPPRGRFHIDTVPRGEDPLSAVNVNTLLKSSSSPRALYPGLSPYTARPPLQGGGRRGRFKGSDLIGPAHPPFFFSRTRMASIRVTGY